MSMNVFAELFDFLLGRGWTWSPGHQEGKREAGQLTVPKLHSKNFGRAEPEAELTRACPLQEWLC